MVVEGRQMPDVEQPARLPGLLVMEYGLVLVLKALGKTEVRGTGSYGADRLGVAKSVPARPAPLPPPLVTIPRIG